MSKRQAKKIYTCVHINAADAAQLALILQLHYETCGKRLSGIQDLPKDTPEKYAAAEKARKSWARMARKSWEFAAQFESVSHADDKRPKSLMLR